MTDNLKPYPAYSDTDVSWLPRIPANWKLEPALAMFQPRQVKNTGLIEKTVLSLSYGRIIVKPEEKLHGLVPKSFETYQVIDPKDIIVRTTDLQNDRTSLRIGIARDRGIITSAYLNLRARQGISPEFAYQVLNAYDLMKVIYGYGSGLRQNLDFVHIKRMPVPIPGGEEQLAIARYLDHANQKINRYIHAKKKLAGLLNEQKQAIIRGAVMRGLNPDVKLKPSGVEWVGDIPIGWHMRKLGQIAKVFNGTTPSRAKRAYWDGGTIPWLSSGKVNDYVVQTPSQLITERAYKKSSVSIVPRGSVILGLVGQGKTRGMSAWLNIDACINQNLAAIVPGREVDGRYLQHVLTAFYKNVRELGRGGNQEALNCDIVSRLRIPLPPLQEQISLRESIERDVDRVLLVQRSVEREIAFVQEYRIRLVTDVVTGELDVRAAAAKLPEFAPEAEPLDEIEEVLQDEPAAEDFEVAEAA